MTTMPRSTYKPPSFVLVEDVYNAPGADGARNRLRSWDRHQGMLGADEAVDPAQGTPVTGPKMSGAPGNRLFRHFVDHWLGDGSQPYWPGLAGHREEVFERIKQAFQEAVAGLLLLDDDDTLRRRLHMWWVCADPDPYRAVFGVRTDVRPCDVSVVFLTPVPLASGLTAENMSADLPIDSGAHWKDEPSPALRRRERDEADEAARIAHDHLALPDWEYEPPMGSYGKHCAFRCRLDDNELTDAERDQLQGAQKAVERLLRETGHLPPR